jgi:hypothetical protein
VCLGATLGLVAIIAAGCQSELGDGNPGSDFVPPGGGVVPGQPGGPGAPIDPITGVPTPGGEDQPIAPGGLVDRPPPSLAGAIGAVWDAEGNPLPVDQLPPIDTSCNTPGPQQLRRLSKEQYANTLARVFGDGIPLDTNPLIDANTLGYHVDADDALVQGSVGEGIETLAQDVAAFVRQNGMIAQLANNCTDINNTGCREQFVRTVGERLSREPLDQERVTRYAGLFGAVAEDGTALAATFEDGAEMVISALIQSPFALYRREIGVPQGAEFVLTPFEVASELSYSLTNEPPDDALMEAARNGQLASPDQILSQAQRLLATPEAAQVLGEFVISWLDLEDLGAKVKDTEMSPEVRAAMLEETRRLFVDVFQNGGAIGELFSADYTFMNQPLADYYGMNGMVTSQDFQEVQTGAGARVPGLLGHGSYLATHALANNTSPVQRAFVVRERILCNDLPPVPMDLDTSLKPQAPTATSRERYAAHSSNGVCYACHQLMDPVGFTFEGFDGYGAVRATEAGKPVDTVGALPLMDGQNPVGISVPMTGVADLANYLSESEQVRACVINNLSYYTYGIANDQKWSATDKACTDNFIRQQARTSGNTLQSVMAGIVSAPHFTRRVQAK